MKIKGNRYKIRIFCCILCGLFFTGGAGLALAAERYFFSEADRAYCDGRFTQPLRVYKLEADRGNRGAILNLAVMFKDLGDYSKAIQVLKNSLKAYANDTDILLLLGRLYYLNGKPDLALQAAQKALIQNPDNLQANTTMGLCLEEKNEYGQAQKYLVKAVSLNGASMVAHMSLADLYYRKGNLNEALGEFKKLNVLDASVISVQRALGDILFRLGNLSEAYKIYQKLELSTPRDTVVIQRLREVKAKLGEDYFKSQRERWLAKRQKRLVKVTPFPQGANITLVRVGIITQERGIGLQCYGPFVVKNALTNGIIVRIEGQKELHINSSSMGSLAIQDASGNQQIVDAPVVVTPENNDSPVTLFNVKAGKGNFWANAQDRSYRGSIEVRNTGQGLTVVNILNLEEYLYSVVASEMSSAWPLEALKAQAVSARSEAMAKLGRHKKEGFDFCAEVHCQSYAGCEEEAPQANRAVDETRGIIMRYEGRPVDAVYSSNCGGHTQNNIFGDAENVPYLKGLPDMPAGEKIVFPLSARGLDEWLNSPPAGIFCDLPEPGYNSSFRWVRMYTVEELSAMFKEAPEIGSINKIIVLKRNPSGHIQRIKIFGTGGSIILDKEYVIRKALGNLRSSMFKVEVKRDSGGKIEKFIFYGGGWGHGVGMCQSGAYGLARAGMDFKKILLHYFSGVNFKKMY